MADGVLREGDQSDSRSQTVDVEGQEVLWEEVTVTSVTC